MTLTRLWLYAYEIEFALPDEYLALVDGSHLKVDSEHEAYLFELLSYMKVRQATLSPAVKLELAI